MKQVFAIVMVLAAIAGGGMFWLAGNIDSLAQDAIVNNGNAMTKARVSVEAVRIAPTSGKGVISNLFVGNPAGFKTPHALKVSHIEVHIDIASLAKDVIVIRLIAIDEPNVIYEYGDAMTNFDAIQKNIASYLGPAAISKDGSSKKLIVEELTVYNATACASAAFMDGRRVSIALPDIMLRNIGKAKGGVTPGELGQEIASALKTKLSAATSFDRLKKSAGELLDKTGTAVKGLFK